jgi:hypothetical protein
MVQPVSCRVHLTLYSRRCCCYGQNPGAQPGLLCSSLFGGGDVGEGDKEAGIQPAPPGTRHQLLRLAVVCRAQGGSDGGW